MSSKQQPFPGKADTSKGYVDCRKHPIRVAMHKDTGTTSNGPFYTYHTSRQAARSFIQYQAAGLGGHFRPHSATTYYVDTTHATRIYTVSRWQADTGEWS